MELSILESDDLYKEIIDSKLNIKELLQMGLKTCKLIKEKDTEEKNSSNLVILNELQKMQTILGISSKKGGVSENIILENICKYFPNADIKSIGFESGKGDILIKLDDINIMLEIKNYKINVPKKEIDKFHRDLINNDYDASIFISINSGITGYKNKFSYEMIGNKFAIYLSNTGTDGLSISWAILFIKASLKLTKKLLHKNKNNINIINNFIENKLKLLKNCIVDANNINDSLIKMKKDLMRNIEISTMHIINTLNMSKNKINDIINDFDNFIETKEINNDMSLLYDTEKIITIENYTLPELKLKARELKLTNYSKLDKKKLVNLIKSTI